MKHEYKKQRWSLCRQSLRERLMREAVDSKIEERRNANEQQKAVGDADRKASK